MKSMQLHTDGWFSRGRGISFLFPLVVSTLLTVGAVTVSMGDGFSDCAHIESDTERLACYDAAYRDKSEINAQQAKSQETASTVMDTESSKAMSGEPQTSQTERQTASEQKFGLPKEPDPDALEILRSSVVRISKTSTGRSSFFLENGQIWVSTKNLRLKIPEPPVTAEIAPGRLGTFFMKLDENNVSIKVKRVK